MASTVAQKLRLAVRPPLVPKPRLQAARPGSMRRPDAPLMPSRSNPEPQKRATRVPPVPKPNSSYERWEGPAIGATKNDLPRYMFKPGQTQQGGPLSRPTLPKA